MSNVPYAQLAEVRAELTASRNEDLSADVLATLESNMVAASRMIDRYKGVEPGAYDTNGRAATQRHYSGNGHEWLQVDQFTSLTEVAVLRNGVFEPLDASDYNIWPYEALAKSEPYRAIENTKGCWLRALRGIRVTAVWGVSVDAPHDIARACKIQTIRWYMRALNSWQDSGMNPMGGLSFVQTLDPDIKILLNGAYPHGGGLR
jgi:hypothetical protein